MFEYFTFLYIHFLFITAALRCYLYLYIYQFFLFYLNYFCESLYSFLAAGSALENRAMLSLKLSLSALSAPLK